MKKWMFEKEKAFFKTRIKKLIIKYLKSVDPDLMAYCFGIDDNTDCNILIERWWKDEDGQSWHSYGTRKERLGENEWIKTEDKLPEPYESVLVYSKDRCEIAFYDPCTYSWISDCEFVSLKERPWWRPLPTRPMMEAENDLAQI